MTPLYPFVPLELSVSILPFKSLVTTKQPKTTTQPTTTAQPTTRTQQTTTAQPTTTPQQTSTVGLDCTEICGGADEGNIGSCCSSSYCDCGTQTPINCNSNEVFCDNVGMCSDLGDGTCEGTDWCCSDGTTSTSTTVASSISTTNVDLTTSTTTISLDCTEICGGADEGNIGICCSNTFCDCITQRPQTCENDDKFCDEMGMCSNFGGEPCEETEWCCSNETTSATTATTSTTATSLDCNDICGGADIGYAGNCCDIVYCDCGSKEQHECPPDNNYCDMQKECINLFGTPCQEADFCCSKKFIPNSYEKKVTNSPLNTEIQSFTPTGTVLINTTTPANDTKSETKEGLGNLLLLKC